MIQSFESIDIKSLIMRLWLKLRAEQRDDSYLKGKQELAFKELENSFIDACTELMTAALTEHYITHVEIQMGIATGPDKPSPEAKNIIRGQLEELIENDDACVLVALQGETVVGVAIGCIEEEYGSRYGDFWDVIVRPDFRAMGVGGKLIEMIHSFFRRRGMKSVYLDVNPENREAISIYERLGYETVSAVMRKEL